MKQRQDQVIQIRCSKRFKTGLRRATKAANEPNVSEFLKKAAIREADRIGVEIKR